MAPRNGLRHDGGKFAVIGLGVALGSAAFVVGLAAWGQVSADVNTVALTKYGTSGPKLWPWGKRVQRKVGKAIDGELKARRADDSFEHALERWRGARTAERETRAAVNAVDAEVAKLLIPVAANKEQPDWKSAESVVRVTDSIARDDPPPIALSSERITALHELKDQANAVYKTHSMRWLRHSSW